MTANNDYRQLMSDVKFYNDYSREVEGENRLETWDEAVERVMNMHRKKYDDVYDKNSEFKTILDEVEEGYKEKRFLGAQRALQFGGEQLLKNNAKLYNCTASYADRIDFFSEYGWFLLSGAGVGVSVQNRHISKLPKAVKPSGPLKTHVIEDSIEGWADAWQIQISSFFEPCGGKFDEWSGKRVHFEYHKVRDKGSLISGGFKAPGPEPLRQSIQKIEKLLFDNIVEGERAKSIVVYDICMFIADAVISGGVRRSATIFLFGKDDMDMMKAKIGDWRATNPQRQRSNNSVVLLRNETTLEEFKSILEFSKQYGEPGFVWTDDLDALYNPCVEIGLFAYLDEARTQSGFQGCNLSEINGQACKTEEEFYSACRLASAIGTMQAGYTHFPYLTDVTKEIFDREALIGVSITGWMNNPDILFNERILKEGARIVVETNEMVAAMIGINAAARTTTSKPSGNASVILKTSSGIALEHAYRYIRYNTYTTDSDLINLIKDAMPYIVEEGQNQSNSYVVGFPVTNESDAIVRGQLTAVEHLEKVKFAYENWVKAGTVKERCVNKNITHNISNTINVKDDEYEEVFDYIYENRQSYGGVSILGVYGDKDFFQAPWTEVLTSEQIQKEYGDGAFFASGLIVDCMSSGFDNLWDATMISSTKSEDELVGEKGDQQREWRRRFLKFSETFFESDNRKTGYCLKDVYLLHKWNKITKNMVEVDFVGNINKKELIDVDTLGAVACAGGACEIAI